MAYTQRSYINPETKMMRDQQDQSSSGCRSCKHHAYIGTKKVRVCNKYDLVGTNMSPCADYKDNRTSLEKANSLFGA